MQKGGSQECALYSDFFFFIIIAYTAKQAARK